VRGKTKRITTKLKVRRLSGIEGEESAVPARKSMRTPHLARPGVKVEPGRTRRCPCPSKRNLPFGGGVTILRGKKWGKACVTGRKVGCRPAFMTKSSLVRRRGLVGECRLLFRKKRYGRTGRPSRSAAWRVNCENGRRTPIKKQGYIMRETKDAQDPVCLKKRDSVT